MIAIGIDIGGTKVAAGRVTPEGVLEARTEVPMPKGSADAREAMLALVRELHTADVVAIGMGAPGLITPEGRFTWGPNVSIADLPLRDMIEEEFRVPAVVDNDVNVAAVAEHRVGAARGTKNALMITVGTGIGGGLIVDGRLYRGVSFAGEVGHMVIERDGALCTCGRRGCW
ncbi:MAG: ROK family protein, partial [Myxococcales bacterium]|nr:ROK family protein [Myxococcales bacterium]